VVGLRSRRSTGQELQFVLASHECSAGGSFGGAVLGADEPVTVTVMRLERSPSATLSFGVSDCELEPVDGRVEFELPLPDWLPPGWSGERTGLGYAARALSGTRRNRRYGAVPLVISGGEQAIHQSAHADRVIASHPGRRFHLELSDVRLQGGGHIQCRVHAEAGLEEGSVVVVARFEEAWRTNLRVRNRRHPPLWRSRLLWQEEATVELGIDRRWYPCGFDIPVGLPPAVEGRTLAWRYEIDARRAPRRGVADRAALTPLRFDLAQPPSA
jgi:hypothetical protein